jgi:hypothetical protein
MLSIEPSGVGMVGTNFMNFGGEVSLPKMELGYGGKTFGVDEVPSLPKDDRIIPTGFVKTSGQTIVYREKDGQTLPWYQVAWSHDDAPLAVVEGKGLKRKERYTDITAKKMAKDFGLEQGYSRRLLENVATTIFPTYSEQLQKAGDANPNLRIFSSDFEKYLSLNERGKIYRIETNDDESVSAVIDAVNYIFNKANPEQKSALHLLVKERFEDMMETLHSSQKENLEPQMAEILQQLAKGEINIPVEEWDYIPFAPGTFAALGSREDEDSSFGRYAKLVRGIVAKRGKFESEDEIPKMSTNVGGITFGYSSRLGTTVALVNHLLPIESYIQYEGFTKESKAIKFFQKAKQAEYKANQGPQDQKKAAQAKLETINAEFLEWLKEEGFIKKPVRIYREGFPVKVSIDEIKPEDLSSWKNFNTLYAKAILAEKTELRGAAVEGYKVDRRKDGRIAFNVRGTAYDYSAAKRLERDGIKGVIYAVRRVVTKGKDTNVKEDAPIRLKNSTFYTPTMLQMGNALYPMAFSKEFNEKIAHPVQMLSRIDENGAFTYEKANPETGEVEKVTVPVEVEKHIKQVNEMVEEIKDKKILHPHVKAAARELAQKLSEAVLLDGTDRYRKVIQVINDRNASYAKLVEGALATSVSTLSRALGRSYVAKRYPEAAQHMLNEVLSGLADETLTETATYPAFKAHGDKNQRIRDKKNMASLYYDIVRNNHVWGRTVYSLAEEGKKTEAYAKRIQRDAARAGERGEEVSAPSIFASAYYAPMLRQVADIQSIYEANLYGDISAMQSFRVRKVEDPYIGTKAIMINGEKREVPAPKSFGDIEKIVEKKNEEYREVIEEIEPVIEEIVQRQKEQSSTMGQSPADDIMADILGVEATTAVPDSVEPEKEPEETQKALIEAEREFMTEQVDSNVAPEAEAQMPFEEEGELDVAAAFGLDEEEDPGVENLFGAVGEDEEPELIPVAPTPGA